MRIPKKSAAILGLSILALSLACSSSSGGPVLPVFTTQPVSQTVHSGGTAVFSVAASGMPAPTFVWSRSDDGGSTWSPISGATSSTYAFTVQASDNGSQFRAVASNAYADVTSIPAIRTEVPAVYAGGATQGVPGYWLNGTWVALALPPGGTWLPPYLNLAVNGGDVYAVGSCVISQFQTPGYWRNGTWASLALPAGAGVSSLGPASIAFSQGSVYIAGFEVSTTSLLPGYWVNGTWTGLTLPSGAAAGGTAMSLAVSGAEVIVAGYYPTPGTGTSDAAGYWANGAWVALAPSGTVDNVTGAVAVSGSNVLVAGTVSGSAGFWTGYWLNGAWKELPAPSGFSWGQVNSLFMSGSDVYAGGTCFNLSDPQTISQEIPGYWLNGAWVSLPIPSGQTGGEVDSLVVSGGEVYAAGSCFQIGSPDSKPGYWHNGAWVDLSQPSTTGRAFVSSIVVIP